MDKTKIIKTVERILENNLDLIRFSDELEPNEIDWAFKRLIIEVRELN